jgi:hypothetical protein
MDGRAQLHSLANAIGGASDIEAAWAGTGPSVDVRKSCGICGTDQPLRLPFLRHVCRSCQAIWVPGICVDCAHTSVTFTMDGQLSRFASCGCGGALRQVAYVPKPRAAVDPEVMAARQAVVAQHRRRATWGSRAVLVALAALATVGGVRYLHANHTTPERVTTPVSHVDDADDTRLSMQERGRRAAARLRANGENQDVFSCAAQLPRPAATSLANQGVSGQDQAPGSGAGSKDFLAGCLTG